MVSPAGALLEDSVKAVPSGNSWVFLLVSRILGRIDMILLGRDYLKN